MESIFNSIQKLLTPELKSKISSFIGEDNSKVSSAISSIVPSFLGSLLTKGDDKNIEGVLKDAGNSDIMSNVLGLLSDTKSETTDKLSSGFTSSLFGDKLNGFQDAISSTSGVSKEGISKLTCFISPLLAGFLGNKMKTSNIGLSDIISKLSLEKDSIMSAIPLGLSGSLGFASNPLDGAKAKISKFANKTEDIAEKAYDRAKDNLDDIWAKTKETASKVENFAENAKDSIEDNVKQLKLKKENNFLWLYLLGIATLGILGYYFIKKQFSDGFSRNNVETIENLNLNDSVDYIPSIAKETVQITLPDGGHITGFKNGVEEKVVNLLTSEKFQTAKNEDIKDKWFDFDNIRFEHGSGNELTGESYQQINNLIVILKEFKDIKFKIGAYTDKTGDEEANLKISNERANTIKDIFVKAGFSPERISTEGYGSQLAKVSEGASDKERESDRKISIRFEK